MNAKEKKMLSLIDKQIAELQKAKEQLLATKPLSEIIHDKPYLWVIDKNNNKYYQYKYTLMNLIQLDRFGVDCTFGLNVFNDNFRIATSVEFKQHIEHLERTGKFYIKQNFTQRVDQREASEHKVLNLDFASLYQNEVLGIDAQKEISKPCDLSEPMVHTIDPKKCDFYMVTVTGEHGSKVRHDNYDIAIKEATRLAKKKNHKAWVTGVVAVIEPIQQEVQVKVIEK